MKRLILIWICLLFWSRSAQSQVLELSCGGYFAYQNDTVDVPILVSGFTNLISFQASIQLDTTIIELVEVTHYAASFSLTNITSNSGIIRIVWFDNTTGTTLITGDTLCILRMLVIGNPGEVSPIEFVNQPLTIEAFNSSFNLLSTSLVQGSVAVLGLLLPIKLNLFRVTRLNESAVDFYWETSNEENNVRFEIERLLEEEEEPYVITSIEGGKQSMKYQYLDNNSYQGISYYRLKQIDEDETITYFDWHSVKGANLSDNLLVYYANNSINIRTNEWENQAVYLSIQSYSGQVIYQQKIKLIAHQLFRLPTHQLTVNQSYVICLTMPDGIQKIRKILFVQ